MNINSKRRLLIPVAFITALAFAAGCSGKSTPSTSHFEVRSLDVPAAIGATGPNLATGPDGRIVLSWIEPDGNRHKLRYSMLRDGSWDNPGTVVSAEDMLVNMADFPSVVPLSDSLWASHWIERQPAGGHATDVLLSLSPDGGATWSAPIKPHTDGTPTEHGFVTLFPDETSVGAIWLDGRNTVNPPRQDEMPNGTMLRAATVTSELALTNEAEVDGLTCDCCQTDVAVTEEGAIAVYRDRSENETRDIYAARLVGGNWQPGVRVAEDGWTIAGCPVNGPVIDANEDRVVVAWFTAPDDQPRVRIATSIDAGASFSAPVNVVEGNSSGRVGLALLPKHGVAVSWVCESPEGGNGMCLRSVSSAGELGPVHVLSGQHNVPSFSVPQLARSGDSLVAAWTAEIEGNTVVASGKIPIASLF